MIRSRLAERLRDEAGIALVMAVGILTVLAISTATIISVTTSNFTTSTRAKVDEATLYAAESGVSEAISILSQAPDPRVTTTLPNSQPTGTVITVGASEVTYWGAYNAGTRRWTLTAQAITAAPNGGGAQLTRTVTEEVQLSQAPGTTSTDPAWKYVYVDRNDGCTEFHSSVEIYHPVYLKNSLCMYSSARILGSAGEVQVNGANGIWKESTSSYIGDSGAANYLAKLRVANRGCKVGGSPGGTGYQWACTTGQRVYATDQQTVLDAVTKPPLDLAGWYASADPGPLKPCDPATSSYAGPGGVSTLATFFDTNTTMGDSTAVRNIMPAFDYSCRSADGVVRFAWDYRGSTPGVLTINGAVFFDGSISMTSSERGLISGKGTIYASKRITLGSSVQLCGKEGTSSYCDWNGWDPTVNLLFLVAGDVGGSTSATCGTSSPHTCSIWFGSSIDFQGGLYAQNMIWLDSSAEVQGPMVGHGVRMQSSTFARTRPFTDLPVGAPAVPKWQVDPVYGTWRET